MRAVAHTHTAKHIPRRTKTQYPIPIGARLARGLSYLAGVLMTTPTVLDIAAQTASVRDIALAGLGVAALLSAHAVGRCATRGILAGEYEHAYQVGYLAGVQEEAIDIDRAARAIIASRTAHVRAVGAPDPSTDLDY